MVEHDLAKVGVASSSLVSRSSFPDVTPGAPGVTCFKARWQSGHAAACKAVYAGSIPTLASTSTFLASIRRLPARAGVGPRTQRNPRVSISVRCCPAVNSRVHRHGRAHLEASDRTTPLAPDRDRQPARSLTGSDHLGQRQHGPPVARRAVGVQLMVPGVQASDAAQIDHGPRVLRSEAHRASLIESSRSRNRSDANTDDDAAHHDAQTRSAGTHVAHACHTIFALNLCACRVRAFQQCHAP